MIFISLIGFVALVASALGQHPPYAEYEYQDISGARQAPQPARAYARAAAPQPVARYSPQPPPQQQHEQQPQQPRPTPVAILKQINRHNDDGSYTYGYEGADGSFKIETKLPTGEVMGKYGYVDDTGKLRVIDYGANRYGFQPAGEGITVAPPTLVDETTAKEAKGAFADYDEESIYALQQQQQQQRPARPQKRPEVFAARGPPQAVARGYPGLEQEIRQAPVPAYQQVPVRYTPTAAPAPLPAPTHIPAHAHIPQQPQIAAPAPAPVRFVPQARRAPPRFAPAVQVAQVPQHAAPVPARAEIPNAVSAGAVFTPAAAPAPRPAPVREAFSAQAAAPVSAGVLDQLLKQYALPAGAGQPLHDISFGSYSSQTAF